MDRFRVAVSGDFKKPDGSPSFPEFDLSPLLNHEQVDLVYLEDESPISAAQLQRVDALILLGNQITSDSFAPEGRLSVIARFGVGYDNVDVAACTANDCALVITPDGVRQPVAVSILTLLFALSGKLMVKDRIARRGPDGWAEKTRHNGVGLVGRTLGSVGMGNIGRELFRVAQPFGMTFIAHDPYADPGHAAQLGVELVELDDVFRRADFVSINCPLTESTRHLVNRERLHLMKPDAYLINTSRGPLVDQSALTQVLRSGRIAGAGLDVLETEPPEADDPILTLDNVIITPHALCWTDQLFQGNGRADVVAVMKLISGELPTGIVNREIVSSPVWVDRLAGYRSRFA